MRLDAEVIHARRSAATYARWENLVLPLRFAERMEGWEGLPVPRRTPPTRRAFQRASRFGRVAPDRRRPSLRAPRHNEL